MKFTISSAFGELSPVRNGRIHHGIDLAMPTGTELRSLVEGTVEKIVDYGAKNIGKGVVIRGEDGNLYTYGHLEKILVEKGQHLHSADIIGLSGNSGHSTGPHLHFQIQKPDGTFLDPTPYAEKLDSMSGHIYGYIGTPAPDGSVLDWFNDFTGDLVRGEIELIMKPIGIFLKECGLFLWDWFVFMLPDIMGYGTILAGVCIMVGAAVGKGGMIKPLAWYGIALILAICILGNV